MAIRNFIDTSTIKSVFLVCDIDNSRAILNDNVSTYTNEDIIYIHDAQYGNYIYANGYLYGSKNSNAQIQDIEKNIKMLQDDMHDVAEFVYDQHTKISKNTDNINTLKNKVENKFKTYDDKLEIIDKTYDVIDSFSGLIFDVSVFAQNQLYYNSFLPDINDLTDCSLNAYPEEFLNNYIFSILNNNLTNDISTLLTKTAQVQIRCFNVEYWNGDYDNYYIIPGTFTSSIVDATIEYEQGDIYITRHAKYIIQQVMSDIGLFARLLDITYYMASYEFSEWKYFKTTKYITKDKIIHDFVTTDE